MTNEEAIKDFEQQNRLLLGIRTTGSQETYERNLMAIEALKAQKVSKWKAKDFHTIFCPECKLVEIDIMQIPNSLMSYLKHCPNCGARMEGTNDK